MIPSYIIEEHNEAFLVWHRSVEEGAMPRFGNDLVHVDEHSDFGVPRLKESINEVRGWDELHSFVYQNLKIGNFILPAVYMGFFKSVYWVKSRHDKEDHRTRFVRSYNGAGKKLVLAKSLPAGLDFTDDDVRSFDLYRQEMTSLDCGRDAVLDIDLDYFSAEENPSERADFFIEITRGEYERFQADKYHQMNFLGPIVEAVEESGRFFYAFDNYEEIYPSALGVSEKVVKERIDELAMALSRAKLFPKLITICRSMKSGFTPVDQAELIEANLLRVLKDLYPLDIRTIDSIG